MIHYSTYTLKNRNNYIIVVVNDVIVYLLQMPQLSIVFCSCNTVINLRFNILDNKISYLTQKPSKNRDKNYFSDEVVCPNLTTLALSRNVLDTVEQFVIVSNKLRILYLVIRLKTHIILECTNTKHVFVIIMPSELQQDWRAKWIRQFTKSVSFTLAW